MKNVVIKTITLSNVFWIGLNDSDNADGYAWVTGEPVDYIGGVKPVSD